MNDKALVFLIVVFLIVGIYTYDQYSLQKNGVSPVAQFLDFGGFIGANRDEDPNLSVVHSSFEYSVRNRLGDLQEKHQQIQAQRRKLLSNRAAILTELRKINNDTQQDALDFMVVVNKERDEFFERYPQLQSVFGKLVEATQQTGNLSEDQAFELKQDIFDMIDETTENTVDYDRLSIWMEEAEDVLNAQNGALLSECDADQECLQQGMARIQSQITDLFGGMVLGTSSEYQALEDLLLNMEEEYAYQLKQVEVVEKNIDESFEYTENQSRELVDQLVNITQKDLIDLIYMYQELEMQQETLMDIIEYDQEKLYEKHILGQQRIKSIIEDLPDPSGKILKNYKRTDARRRDLIYKIDRNAENMLNSLSDQYEQIRTFYRRAAKLIEIDLDRLVADSEYARAKNQTYIVDRRNLGHVPREAVHRKSQDIKRPPTIKSPDTISQPPEIKSNLADLNSSYELKSSTLDNHNMRLKQREVQRNMKDARNKARDQGFYK